MSTDGITLDAAALDVLARTGRWPLMVKSDAALIAQARAALSLRDRVEHIRREWQADADRMNAALSACERERDEYRDANLSVRVCKDHAHEVAGIGCLVCERDEARAQVAEREAEIARLVALLRRCQMVVNGKLANDVDNTLDNPASAPDAALREFERQTIERCAKEVAEVLAEECHADWCSSHRPCQRCAHLTVAHGRIRALGGAK